MYMDEIMGICQADLRGTLHRVKGTGEFLGVRGNQTSGYRHVSALDCCVFGDFHSADVFRIQFHEEEKRVMEIQQWLQARCRGRRILGCCEEKGQLSPVGEIGPFWLIFL